MLASLACVAPVWAQPIEDESDRSAGTPKPNPELKAGRFDARVAAIVAERAKAQSGAWAGLDRERLASGFRLTGKAPSVPPAGPPDGLLQSSSGAADLLWRNRRAPVPAAKVPLRRGISFGLDGLPDSDQPAIKAEPVPIRSSEQGLPQSRTCEGLMPAMACTTLASVGGGPRVALAYNF